MQISSLRERLSSALLDFAWEEWAQMGVLAAARRDRRWAQDPEALLLLTFEVGRADPRLFDEVLDWLVSNEPLISARRLRTLADGPDDERLLAAVLEWVRRQRRPHGPSRQQDWPASDAEALFPEADLPTPHMDQAFLAFGFTRPPAQPSGKSRQPDLTAPINFGFRLRQLLGLSARAEAIRYLLTAEVESATVADVAEPSGYSKRNIQEALGALRAAGVATFAYTGGEQRFAVDRSRWAHLLDLEPHELPMYRDWPTLLGVLRQMLRWLKRPELESLSEYLRASEAAALLDVIRPQLSRAGVFMSARQGGGRSWSDLEETVENALLWLAPDQNTDGRPAAFEIIPDASEGHWWRLTTSAGRIVATSAERYASGAAAKAAAERVRHGPQRLAFKVISDVGAYRWIIVAENGRILAGSSESFATERDAERAARDARDLAAGAAPPSANPSESVNRARRHVTRRPDGRWQVQAEGATRAASTHATQADAERSARRQLNNGGGGELIVHTRDGRIRSSGEVRENEPRGQSR